jgi:hypothetical protein
MVCSRVFLVEADAAGAAVDMAGAAVLAAVVVEAEVSVVSAAEGLVAAELGGVGNPFGLVDPGLRRVDFGFPTLAIEADRKNGARKLSSSFSVGCFV